MYISLTIKEARLVTQALQIAEDQLTELGKEQEAVLADSLAGWINGYIMLEEDRERSRKEAAEKALEDLLRGLHV